MCDVRIRFVSFSCSFCFPSFCWYALPIFLAGSLALLIFGSLVCFQYFLSLFFDVPVIFFTSISYHLLPLSLSFLFASISVSCSSHFLSSAYHVPFISSHRAFITSFLYRMSISCSSHDHVIAFHYPFACSFSLSFYPSFPYLSTFMSHGWSLPLWTWIWFCGKHVSTSEILWKTTLRHPPLDEETPQMICIDNLIKWQFRSDFFINQFATPCHEFCFWKIGLTQEAIQAIKNAGANSLSQ